MPAWLRRCLRRLWWTAEHAGAIVGGVRMRRAFVVAVTVLGVASVSAAPAFAHAGGLCRVPRLNGLTLTIARARAAHAGCRLRVSGAALKEAGTLPPAYESWLAMVDEALKAGP